MKNLENSPRSSESNSQAFELMLKSAIAVSFERTGTEPYDISNLSIDVYNEFKDINPEWVIEGIRRGSLGHYGKTFKLTTQEICIWVRNYLAESPGKTKSEIWWDSLDKLSRHLIENAGHNIGKSIEQLYTENKK